MQVALSKFIGRYSLGKERGSGSSHFLRIKIPGGVIGYSLVEIAELSDDYGRGYAEITTRQDIQLHWIDPDAAIDIFERLYKIGYTKTYAARLSERLARRYKKRCLLPSHGQSKS